MYFVYILKGLKYGKLYTGYTNDLKRRFFEYNSGLIKITKWRRPFKLIFYEAFLNQQDATAREKYFKSLYGSKERKRIVKEFLGKNK